MMKNFRENPYTEIASSTVTRLEDYQLSEAKSFKEASTEVLSIPKSNVLIYYTEDGSKIAMRPSGTEPKIKFYISVHTSEKNKGRANEILSSKIEAIKKVLNTN